MRRTGAAIALAMIVAMITGCASGRSFERWSDDRGITAKVKMRMMSLRGPGTWIHVDTYDRTVYLSGVIDDPETKLRAEALAWDVPGVEMVVPNLMVKRSPPATATSIRTDGAHEVWTRTSAQPHPLLAVLPDVVRIEAAASGRPGAPSLAYDESGRRVATIYVVTMRELAETGRDGLRADGYTIDHVDIYPVASAPDVPEPTYHVVLWHLTRTHARPRR
jgi:hypothetical protein